MQESGENYLEVIYTLLKEKPPVRALDIANRLNFSKPSITRATKILVEKGFILIDEKKEITLTDKGKEKAKEIAERHEVFTKFLMLLGVDEKTADEDGCKMEHDLSEKSFLKIKEWVKKTW